MRAWDAKGTQTLPSQISQTREFSFEDFGGFRVCGFRVWGFRGLGFRGLELRGLWFRGFRVLSKKVWIDAFLDFAWWASGSSRITRTQTLGIRGPYGSGFWVLFLRDNRRDPKTLYNPYIPLI